MEDTLNYDLVMKLFAAGHNEAGAAVANAVAGIRHSKDYAKEAAAAVAKWKAHDEEKDRLVAAAILALGALHTPRGDR